MTINLYYNPETDVILQYDKQVRKTIDELNSLGFLYHHTSTRCGYVQKYRQAGILKPYSGRFGDGYMLLTYRGCKRVRCDYYIKVE